MYLVFTILVPVFSLIALGFVAGRFHWVGEQTTRGLNDFTFVLAIPAMLFHAMVVAEFPNVAVYRIWGAYFGTALIIWCLATLATWAWLRREAIDSPFVAMSSAFGNVVMLGIPLATATFGATAAAPLAVIISLHSLLLWSLATCHLVWVQRLASASAVGVVKEVFADLSRNFIIIAILAGTLWRYTGLELPAILSQTIKLLGQAAVPCALVSLGLSLTAFAIKGQARTLSMILVLKNLAMPVVAWILAIPVLNLDAVDAGVVVLCAAMPTGANAYVFAMRYKRATNSASGAVALGIVISVFTVGATIYLLRV